MVQNNTDLRKDMTEVYNKLREHEIGMEEAKQLANVAGKVIKSATAQMEYNKYVGSKRKIDFFEDTTDGV